jgi:hypothetical protein
MFHDYRVYEAMRTHALWIEYELTQSSEVVNNFMLLFSKDIPVKAVVHVLREMWTGTQAALL